MDAGAGDGSAEGARDLALDDDRVGGDRAESQERGQERREDAARHEDRIRFGEESAGWRRWFGEESALGDEEEFAGGGSGFEVAVGLGGFCEGIGVAYVELE